MYAPKTILFVALCTCLSSYAQVDTTQFKVTFRALRDSVALDNIKSYSAIRAMGSLLTKELKHEQPKFYEQYHKQYESIKKSFIEAHSYLRYVIDDNSIYGEMQKSWRANQIINYGTPAPFFTPLGNRRSDPKAGEGTKLFYLLEANLDQRFNLNMGRPQAPGHRRRMRMTFDYRVNFRMTLDDSNPIVPYTNDVGLGYECVLNDSYHGSVFKDASRYDQTSYADLLSRKVPIKKHAFVSALLQAHHYSNGQNGKSFSIDTQGEKRNNYLNGNFSTNYIRLRIARSKVNIEKRSLFTTALGLRKDGSVGSFLNYDSAQKKSYGYWRAEYLLDWYTPLCRSGNECYARQYHVRLEGDLILDKDLSNFAPNLIGKADKKYRLGLNLFLESRPLSHRAVGYMLRFYAGRDYLNIRYDDIIFTAQFGLTLSLDKYYPSGWYPKPSDLKKRVFQPQKWFKKSA